MPRLRFRRVRWAVGATLAVTGIMAARASIRAADDAAAGWPSYNRTLTSDRYSPLDQINRSNVGKLKQLCVFDLGVDVSFQAGPIVIGRVLYATTDREIFAIDADTCGLKWREREEGPPLGLASTAARRTGWTAVPRDRRRQRDCLRRGHRQKSLDAEDRRFGTRRERACRADCVERPRVHRHGRRRSLRSAWPDVCARGRDRKDRLGNLHGSNRRAAAREREGAGARQGDMGQPERRADQRRRHVDVIHAGSRAGVLYVPVGNPAPDFTLSVRAGDNLYTNSVLILDAKTGIYRNHYSLVPADFHDWDLAAAPAVITSKSGKRIVAATPKDGLLYAYNSRPTSGCLPRP